MLVVEKKTILEVSLCPGLLGDRTQYNCAWPYKVTAKGTMH
jgi:hypothetical protein